METIMKCCNFLLREMNGEQEGIKFDPKEGHRCWGH